MTCRASYKSKLILNAWGLCNMNRNGKAKKPQKDEACISEYLRGGLIYPSGLHLFLKKVDLTQTQCEKAPSQVFQVDQLSL